MCTVTFIARRSGYALGMNRDEKLTRVRARPAARHRLGDGGALFPSEPNGGTWVGVNDSGATLALINWYSVATRVAGETVSRGEAVRSALHSESPAGVDAALAQLPLNRVNSFRLIGVFPKAKTVVEWRWDLRQLQRFSHPWQTNIWISSGFDEPGAQRTRGNSFREALRQSSAGSTEWLRRLQRAHGPERGPYSLCMHRDDATTVSYTEVVVSPRAATLRYTPGAPCCTAAQPALSLAILSRVDRVNQGYPSMRRITVQTEQAHVSTHIRKEVTP